MDRLSRIYQVHQLLSSRRYPLPLDEFKRALGVSESTVRRLVDSLRAIGAPILNDGDGRGYFYDNETNFELPGVWLTHKELLGLVTARELLGTAEPSLLGDTLAPIHKKIESILEQEKLGRGQLAKRVRIIRSHGRGHGNSFNLVIQALVERRRLFFHYRGRGKREEELKLVSPQRLIHYRDNWFLDAYCHDAKSLRTYSLDRIRDAELRAGRTREVDDQELDTHFKSSYGIFGGPQKYVGVIAFDEETKEWALDEKWHSEQTTGVLDDGRAYVAVPYASDKELVQDIMRWGPGAEVISPLELREAVARRFAAAHAIYAKPPNAAPDKEFEGSRK